MARGGGLAEAERRRADGLSARSEQRTLPPKVRTKTRDIGVRFHQLCQRPTLRFGLKQPQTYIAGAVLVVGAS